MNQQFQFKAPQFQMNYPMLITTILIYGIVLKMFGWEFCVLLFLFEFRSYYANSALLTRKLSEAQASVAREAQRHS